MDNNVEEAEIEIKEKEEPIDLLLRYIIDMHAFAHNHRSINGVIDIQQEMINLELIHKYIHRIMDIEPSGYRDMRKLREILLNSKIKEIEISEKEGDKL